MGAPELATPSLSPMKRALHALDDLGRKFDSLSAQRKESIAIVGIGCRFPGGVHDAASCWSVLRDGVDAISAVPPDRWNAGEYYDPDPNAPGKMTTRFGGFLPDVQMFDADFFRVSPREAVSLDPQHRLLLEVCWEALEDAGIPAHELAGAGCGVFAGMSAHDYLCLLVKRGAAAVDQYLGSGNAAAMASGRVSYFLGCQGPSLTLDTACSSSLVAVHLACQSLRNRECDQALAGGVNLILCPEITVNFSKAHMLAADGRCKTFDSRADGYVRSEGCGVVVLKRVSDARRDGDRILALIRGSAVNQDGHSSGITVPNGQAQREVIRQALAFAETQPAEIGFVEAHGTGTSLGDPIEMEALASVFAAGRDPRQPLFVGAAKSNFGHMEAAAGIAGLIKTVLALQHQTIPPNLHFLQPNPHLANTAEFPYFIPSHAVDWRRGATRRMAGVSAFGFSGTNVHLVVEEGPDEAAEQGPQPDLRILTLSAKSESGLQRLAESYIDYLRRQPGADFADITVSSNLTRSHFKYRAAILADSSAGAVEKLDALRAGRSVAGLLQGQPSTGQAAEVTFRFAGQADGADPRDWFRECIAQYRVWQSWGILPSTIQGLGLGRYVAACAAGVFPLEDGLRLVAARCKGDLNSLSEALQKTSFASPELGTTDQIIDAPEYWLAEFHSPPDAILTIGEPPGQAPTVEIPASRQQISSALANLYVQGRPIAWRSCHEGAAYRRVRLPGHPFTRQRFWFAPEPVEESKCRFYRTEWKPETKGVVAAIPSDGAVPWLIVADHTGMAESVAARLRLSGRDCELVREADFSDGAAARPGPLNVLHLGPLDIGIESLNEAADGGCFGLLQLIRVLSANPRRLWIATRGAVPVLEADTRALSIAQAPIWGMARVLRREEPKMFGGIVDLDPRTNSADAQLLAEYLLSDTVEDAVAFRSGARYVPRLAETSETPGRQKAIHADGAYLITGGLGSLGMQVARWLAAQGARHIVLTGRSASADQSAHAQAELQRIGAQSVVIQADVSREADVQRVLDSIRETLPPLRGIIHAAGVVDDGILVQQTADRVARVLGPKVQGAWHLHRLTQADSLDFFVLFSAGAGILGSPGQGSYAAANAFLDALAHYRCGVGLPALSINWGPWSGGGMAAGDAYRRRLAEHGVRMLSPETGLAALDRLLHSSSPQVAVFDIDWHLYASHVRDERTWPFLSGVLPSTETPMQSTASSTPSLAERLADFSRMERREILARKIETELSAILRLPAPARIDRQKGFADMGVDSLLALELKDRIETYAGSRLSSTVAFEWPTVNAFADHLLELLFPEEHVSAHTQEPPGPNILADQIDAMSIDEVTARLSDKLASILGERP